MKKFLSENWYKLMTGTSMLVFSFGFLIYAVSPTYANNSNKKEKQKVENTNTVNVPVNKDGSVNIKLSDEQIELLKPPAMMDVNLQQLRGKNIAKMSHPTKDLNRLAVFCYGWGKNPINYRNEWLKMRP
ncbi:MAG: hypothetical protein P8I93_00225 [Crocinitomicaceae bacterium]|nr:hypothetical protein [Crocinitomicaceae bacterium]